MSETNVQNQGTVQGFNVSPHGTYEGFLLKTQTETIQMNFPREWAAALVGFAPAGSEVQVEGTPEKEKGHPSHPVYRLLRVKSGQEQLSVAALHDNGRTLFSGKVERLNYALHGEANGAILDTGDFLHLKPHGAAALQIAVGMGVRGFGLTKPMVGGHHVIEAEEVNGIVLDKQPKPKKKRFG